jgi:hypothetical protein
MLAVVHKSVAEAPVELLAPDSGSPDNRFQANEILTAYMKSYPDAVAMHFDGDSFMALSHKKQALLRPRYVANILCLCWLILCLM